ncbi:MAG: beta-lactamase family protein [Acidobacteria bacterium]|nr:beta-lactamase family protein [Acidobacteriota bacterium]
MNRKLFANCLAVFCLLALPAVSTAQKGTLSPETIKKIEEGVESERKRLNIPGLSVAIAVNNQIVYSNGFGMADLENAIPAKATTVYRTASIAKPMTAVAVMRLAEQGKLDLDAPIQKYCRAFPEKNYPVTARQLLGHLAGVRHYKARGESAGKEHFFTLTDSLKFFKDDPLLFEPGTKYSYTTFGYSVLGCAIEGASGVSYEEYMRDNVWKPAGMEQTGIDDHFRLIPNRARGYMQLRENDLTQLPPHLKAQVKAGDILNAQLHDTSMKIPGGGIASTAVDLVKFAIAVNTDKLVKPATREQMWVVQKTKDGKETGYALGWSIGQTAEGMKLVMHNGNQAGARSELSLLPAKGSVIAIMANLSDVPLNEVLRVVGREVIAAIRE